MNNYTGNNKTNANNKLEQENYENSSSSSSSSFTNPNNNTLSSLSNLLSAPLPTVSLPQWNKEDLYFAQKISQSANLYTTLTYKRMSHVYSFIHTLNDRNTQNSHALSQSLIIPPFHSNAKPSKQLQGKKIQRTKLKQG